VIRAAAGPHDINPGGRDDDEPPPGVGCNPETSSDIASSLFYNDESPFEVDINSDTSSDIASSLFDDDGDDDRSSITSIDTESDAAVHNTNPVGLFATFSGSLAHPDLPSIGRKG